jgi:hypothetical protein
MHKSWKPPRRDERSFYRLVGDFVSEDHLFVSLVKAHSFCLSLSSAQFWFGDREALTPREGFDFRPAAS